MKVLQPRKRSLVVYVYRGRYTHNLCTHYSTLSYPIWLNFPRLMDDDQSRGTSINEVSIFVCLFVVMEVFYECGNVSHSLP